MLRTSQSETEVASFGEKSSIKWMRLMLWLVSNIKLDTDWIRDDQNIFSAPASCAGKPNS
ncbi:MAG: hypothetical protein COA42_10320 [Alteromonadaceae bacterium]|nr:MAG: hypothetical protein COA42_10320 [Alteromonadaceae bacterium]